MEMSDFDEEDDFLKIQESFFEERLDSLGPDLGKFWILAKTSFRRTFLNLCSVTLTQILSAWELSIRQALAKMNINFARDRQMMSVPAAV